MDKQQATQNTPVIPFTGNTSHNTEPTTLPPQTIQLCNCLLLAWAGQRIFCRFYLLAKQPFLNGQKMDVFQLAKS